MGSGISVDMGLPSMEFGIASHDLVDCRRERDAGQRLELRREPRVGQVDAVAAQRDAFREQALALRVPLRQRAVRTNDPMPGEIVVGGEDAADEARRGWVDVAEGADVAFGDRANSRDDPLGAWL